MNLIDFLINTGNESESLDESVFGTVKKEEPKEQGSNTKAAGITYIALERLLQQSDATLDSLEKGVLGSSMKVLYLDNDRAKLIKDLRDVVRILEVILPNIKEQMK